MRVLTESAAGSGAQAVEAQELQLLRAELVDVRNMKKERCVAVVVVWLSLNLVVLVTDALIPLVLSASAQGGRAAGTEEADV